MARKVAKSSLNASTVDILNVIRQYASYDYQQSVPVVQNERQIPTVGEIIYGNPALSNEFLEALVNRIAAVVIKSATFNNPYEFLKKGYIEFGETIEQIFVDIANVVHYDDHLAQYRNFQKTTPSVHTAFAVRNWKVMYPVTIEDQELRTAFQSADGMTDLISRIVNSVYVAENYDEYELVKLMLIEACTHGEFCPRSVGDGTDLKQCAIEFKTIANEMTFMSNKFNEAHVMNVCPKDRQVIFMDARFAAQYDVEVLAEAFNMSRAEFEQRVVLIDSFSTFDNDRYKEIRENCDGLPEITDEQLEAMKSVKAIVADTDWFQIYDNLSEMESVRVAAGLYTNYFYHTWKTIAHSPFANAVVFITETPTPYDTLKFNVDTVSKGDTDDDVYGVITLNGDINSWDNGYQQYTFMETPEAIAKIVGVEPYGCYMFERGYNDEDEPISVVPYLTCDGVAYKGDKEINMDLKVGDTITFTQTDDVAPLHIDPLDIKVASAASLKAADKKANEGKETKTKTSQKK